MEEKFFSKLRRWWNNPQHAFKEIPQNIMFRVSKYPRISYSAILLFIGWFILSCTGNIR